VQVKYILSGINLAQSINFSDASLAPDFQSMRQQRVLNYRNSPLDDIATSRHAVLSLAHQFTGTNLHFWVVC